MEKEEVAIRRWRFPLGNPKKKQQSSHQRKGNLEAPMGYNMAGETHTNIKRNVTQILEKKAWELARSPTSSIFSTFMMAWMMGNTLSIYTIPFIFFTLYNPFMGLLGTNSQFFPLQSQSPEGKSYLPQKVVFAAMNLVALGIGLYKAHSMGLVPTVTEILVDPPTYIPPSQLSIGFMN